MTRDGALDALLLLHEDVLIGLGLPLWCIAVDRILLFGDLLLLLLRLLAAELGDEPGEGAFLGLELDVGALFGDPAVLDAVNVVDLGQEVQRMGDELPNGSKPVSSERLVRTHNAGLAGERALDRVLEEVLANVGVNGGERIAAAMSARDTRR